GSIGLSGSGHTLTIGAGVTVQGNNGSVDVGGNALVNRGTINANAPPGFFQSVRVNGTNWSNSGTLEAINGGLINLSRSWTNSGTIAADGGTVSVNGSWTNTAAINLQNNGSLYLGGTFTLATLGKLNRDTANPGFLGISGTLDLTGQTLDASHGAWE